MTRARLAALAPAGALVAASALVGAVPAAPGGQARTSAEVREPAVAGRFYPAAAETLGRAVRSLLSTAVAPREAEPVAIVVPHAGYIFSGQIAADAFNQVAGRAYDLVVILGANHTRPGFNAIAAYQGRGFRTPLGVAVVDQDTARALTESSVVTADPGPHIAEHSIEVQVPFVQVLFPSARIVPVVVATEDPGALSRFGRLLASTLSGRRVLIVASSDLSHYPEATTASVVDTEMLAAMATLDEDVARRTADRIVAMAAAKALGATRGVVVSYANSSQVAVGERDRVVGYGAVVFARGGPSDERLDRGPTPGPEPSASRLSGEQGRALAALARDTISGFLERETLPLARIPDPRFPLRHRGAFVTLRRNGELRGCIGRTVADAPLPELVSRVAFEAAFRDPRFPPLSRSELSGLEVEVSVLSPPRRVPRPESIDVGRHGVVLRKNGRSAVFLPSVATEQRWNRAELLDNLCAKAGLVSRCWTEGAELEVFEAEVFVWSGHR
jgi:AmmeMemoRadiSam system protein B/AmmeMemoRadiSam system protein A